VTPDDPLTWRASGTYFEACNCDAICPCRRIGGRPGGASTYGECYGALSWHVLEGHFGTVDLRQLLVVMTLRYRDDVIPSTPWDVYLYVDEHASDDQLAALSEIFLGRAGGTVADNYGAAIGTVLGASRAAITLEHLQPRHRIDVVGRLHVESEAPASAPGDVACGIPGFDHSGTELYGEALTWREGSLGFDVVGRRHASFTSDFDYRSSP
jgi:hypothetical protein